MHQRYREMEIKTASPEMLVVRMYEGAIRFAKQAKSEHEMGHIAERGNLISRTLAIVSELQNSLDHEQGGEIALNLDSLYGFVVDRLLESNLRGNMEAIDEAVSILEELHSAWVEIAQAPNTTKVAARGGG